MPIGPAYWTDTITDPSQGPLCDAFKRIHIAGPWQYFPVSHDGKNGIGAIWADNKEGACPLALFGKPRKSFDGLVYFPGEKIAQINLGKRDYIEGIEYATSRGITLTIPFASYAAVDVSFSSLSLGGPSDEFAQMAENIWENRSTILVRDPRLLRLIYLAIAQNYRVTQETLDDLNWVTSKDIDPIYCCIMGLDPKALADAEQTSPSTASA